MTECQNCTAPANGLNLCPVCVDNLADSFTKVTWLWKELQTTITRSDRL